MLVYSIYRAEYHLNIRIKPYTADDNVQKQQE